MVPDITVVIPDRGAAGFTGTVVAPEITRSEVPPINVALSVIGLAPIAEAMADAIAAADDAGEAGELPITAGAGVDVGIPAGGWDDWLCAGIDASECAREDATISVVEDGSTGGGADV